jgi:hypothetical protein
MADRDDDAQPIEGQRLTSWSVLPGGECVRLNLSATDGSERSVVLPFDAVSSLLMTLPRILQAALDVRGFNGTFRVAQPLARWWIEQAVGMDGLVLKLATPDGFEVTFAFDGGTAEALGTALVGTSRMSETAPKVSFH